MSDIKIQIKNYKLIKDFDQEHKNARILLVTGKNEVGKSSLIRGLIENMTAKSQTDDPVSHGELAGTKTFTIPDKDGNPVTIVHEFSNSNKKGSFYAIDHEGRKVKEVNKIREIIGVFEEISIDTFYTMQQTAAGRRKIIETYFYPLLRPTERVAIEDIDKQTSKGGELYDKRTETNQKISYLQSLVTKDRPTEEDKVLATEYENLATEINRLEAEKLDASEKSITANHVKAQLREVTDLLEQFPQKYFNIQQDRDGQIQDKLDEIRELEKRIEKANADIAESKAKAIRKTEELHEEEKKLKEKANNLKEVSVEFPPVNDLEESLAEARSFRDQSLAAKSKVEKYEDSRKALVAAQNEAIDLERQIQEGRNKKKKILSDSELPAGLSIEEDDFTWNGFAFTETQISKSSALLVIAEILCKILTAKVVYLGEKALFDKDRFRQLIKIAEKHGKIPVLEEVVDEQTDLKVITEVEDV